MSMGYEYGVQYDSYPTDVVMGRPINKDGTVTKIIWQSQFMNEAAGRQWAVQCILAGAPLNAVRRKAVRRQVGYVEDA